MPMSAFGKLAWLLCAGGFVAAWYYQAQPGQTQAAFMAFLDVGQGDATYIRTSTGSDIFIDGGPDRTILERAPEVMQPFDTTIETLILTHPDADHITGMVELVKRYDVQQIVTTALPATKPLHIELLGLIKQKQIQHVIVSAGDHLQFDSTTTCTVLYPSGTIQELSQLETNDTSLILECQFNALSILFTGDISSQVEQNLVGAIHELPLLNDIDLLKVPHHGSNSSSTAEFLAAITPELCVIEVGQDNQYNHPRPEVLNRLQPYCQIRRTDLEGTIILPLD